MSDALISLSRDVESKWQECRSAGFEGEHFDAIKFVVAQEEGAKK